MESKTKAYFQIHTAVLLYGLTGILGELILLPKPTLVWWRMLLAPLGLLILPGVIKTIRKIPPPIRLRMFGIGCLVALHWVTFFGAIGMTNVSVTLACMASASFFTSFLEPLLLRTKFKWYETLIGLIMIPGVAMIYGSSNFEFLGILVALLSAFLAALFSVLNKPLVKDYDPVAMTAIQLSSGWFFLCLLAPFFYLYNPEASFLPEGLSIVYLLILAFVCTSFAYVINLNALKELSTFSVNLTINMEPVYSIILAYVILAENKELESGFYFGAAIIIVSVFIHPLLNRWMTAPAKTPSSQ